MGSYGSTYPLYSKIAFHYKQTVVPVKAICNRPLFQEWKYSLKYSMLFYSLKFEYQIRQNNLIIRIISMKPAILNDDRIPKTFHNRWYTGDLNLCCSL